MVRKVDPLRHEEKRAEILTAAERCFAQNGFHGATIAQICEAAGISPGHLYHYFDGKEAIIGAIARTGLDYVASRSAGLMKDGNAVEAVVAELESLKSHHRESKSAVLLDILAEASRNPAIAEILQETSRSIAKLLAEFLRQGQRRGDIDPNLDTETAATVLLSIIDSCKTLSIRNPDLDPARSAKVLETMITRFLSPRGKSV